MKTVGCSGYYIHSRILTFDGFFAFCASARSSKDNPRGTLKSASMLTFATSQLHRRQEENWRDADIRKA